MTPLALIIGSGFLVLGPILDVSYGGYAPLVMLGLCALAYLFGSAIRFDIAQLEETRDGSPYAEQLETAASVVLAFAYIISVAYYRNIFGAFGVSLTSMDDGFRANLLTTAVYVLILFFGWTYGFSALERMEQVSVSLKLAIIAGLIFGLAVHFGKGAVGSSFVFDSVQTSGWASITLMAGLLVTVQGFETSRYLGAVCSAGMRIRSMRLAQLISTGIYIVYIILLTYSFRSDPLTLSETSIIDLMDVVAPVLPILLVVAALSAQFSAGVADTGGSGGLIAELTRGRFSHRSAYAILVGLGLLLTWTADTFLIISHASRAFALYYGIQAGSAALRAWGRCDWRRWGLFSALTVLGVAIAVFGTPVE